MFEQLFLLFASTLANAMSAFAGGGAGLVQLPVILLLGLPFPIALATHKFVNVALGIGAFLRFKKEKNLIDSQIRALHAYVRNARRCCWGLSHCPNS